MSEQEKSGDDPGYVKVDKRASHQAEEPAAEAEAVATPEPEPVPQEPAQAEPEPSAQEPAQPEPEPASESEPPPQTLADVGVYGVLRFCVTLLMEQAWVALGLHALPGRETQENLPEARAAIDAVTGLVKQLQPDLDPAEKQELEAGLANLRVNFVRRVG